MLTQIEDTIVTRIEEKLAASTAKVAVQKGFEGLPKPAVYVSTESGSFSKVTMTTWKQELSLWVDILFSHLSDERERRKGIYLILEGVLQSLLLQKLDLAITPIQPKSWRNTTPEEYRKQGLLAFSLELTTSYTISRLDDEAVDELLTVGLNYILTPGDTKQDASDVVNLEIQA